MRIPRLLLLSFLASASVAPMAAQSNAPQTPMPPQATPDFSRRAPEFQLQLPAIDQTVQNSPRTGWFQPPSSIAVTTMAQQSSTCYFIQAYRFARATPDPDAVKLTGVSTCQPAAQFEMKDVADPR
jgi:hypothetical protein